ncbi:Exopolysaccharide biosynthesis protein EpsI, predicted pyruvyl transferase [Streptomyces sp. cf124]|uniref:polysaccharide pyruvyl transferase family protein n=1 Tax=Streptomyces sp. cf124 TaxID=1761903 RepID=UPI0008E55B4B|nr:polysaccharide pyruvyl transferase family protein [Streptomyces sp. cf124]SFM68784.1 Exopolysaccharide biosynthesis protein EpsI, predicted pyruvyl transferase [Streptomyces sp. cf124]
MCGANETPKKPARTPPKRPSRRPTPRPAARLREPSRPSAPYASPPSHVPHCAHHVAYVLTVLDRLVPAGTRCALIGAPLNSDVGDSAIWLGQRALLGALGAEVRYACDLMSYDAGQLAACLPDGPIMLTGGGTLGDLWEDSQLLREQVLRDFPDRRIVQLPQSVHFTDYANLTRARRVFDAHPDLTLLLRDRHSLHRCRTVFEARSLLAPDLAFAVPPDALTGGTAAHDVVWLAREDKESAKGPPAGRGAARKERGGPYVFDWTREGDDTGWRRAKEALWRSRARALCRAGSGDPPGAAPALLAAYDGLARLQLARGCRLLTAGRVAVTDRLHGHVLALLLDLPHVLLADRYGKSRSHWDTWTTHRPPTTEWAWTEAEARRTAERLLETVRAA